MISKYLSADSTREPAISGICDCGEGGGYDQRGVLKSGLYGACNLNPRQDKCTYWL